MISDFTTNKSAVTEMVSNIEDREETNIESGLDEAKSMLGSSNAKKVIVLMSDGLPSSEEASK